MRALSSQYPIMILLIAILAVIGGCDPEALVKKKVPQPLQQTLTFSSSEGKKRAVEAKKPEEVTLRIASPANKEVYPLSRPVLFQARIQARGRRIKEKDLVWKLRSGKAKKEKTIGRGRSFRKELPLGMHQVTLTMSLSEERKLVAKSHFRVAAGVVGKVLADGRGLAGTDIVVTGTEEKGAVKRYKTGPDGTFFLEIPSGGVHKITPFKKEFSFSPPYMMVQGPSRAGEVVFRAARAQISDIRLTDAREKGKTLRDVCPGQEAYVRAVIRSKDPVTDLKAFLVPAADIKRQPILIGEATYPTSPDQRRDGPGLKVIEVTIPPKSNQGALTASYKLRVTANDDSQNPFASESADRITVDIPQCVKKKFAEAISAHEKGDSEQAVILYNLIDELHRDVDDPSSMAKHMETNFFNRGLAYLSMALSLEPGNFRRRGYLAKALNDFEQVVKFHRTDADAFLLKGLVSELRKDYQNALQSYGSAISLNPRAAEAYALRGQAYLQTRLKKNLSRAVDDFTKAITLNPQDKSLRKIRRATLKLDLAHDTDPGKALVETSSLPIDKIGQRLDLKRFRRTQPAR